MRERLRIVCAAKIITASKAKGTLQTVIRPVAATTTTTTTTTATAAATTTATPTTPTTPNTPTPTTTTNHHNNSNDSDRIAICSCANAVQTYGNRSENVQKRPWLPGGPQELFVTLLLSLILL